nr:1-phosphatidylinositol-3-phosphate 5-kinase FAB1B-like [Tanacetum cinerariifolium]
MDCCLTNSDAYVIGGLEDSYLFIWDLVDASVVLKSRLGKWLHASDMHRSMYAQFTFLHPNLFTNMKIRNGYKMKSIRFDYTKLLFLEILNALTKMAEKKFGKTSGNSSENMPLSLADLEEMLQKEKAEFESYFKREQSGGRSSPKEENEIDVSDLLRDNVGGGVYRALSKEQISVMASLLDTLNAVWTGNKMDTPSVMCNSDKGHYGEDQLLTTSSLLSPTFSTKGFKNITEDSTSWFSMPFLTFYCAKNKNSIATSQNLDTLNNYKHVYISTYHESKLEGRAHLLLVMGVNDIVISVYDDEPTRIISYVLLTPDYMPQMSGD